MTLSFEKKLTAKLSDFYGKSLLVALSGGKDSVSLLHFLKKNQGINSYRLSACHVNHMFRKRAGWDEKFCSDFCENLDIPFVSYKCDVPRYCAVKKMSFEHGARVVRYRAIYDAAKQFGADAVLTAHTRDDAVETFFIQAVQGASIFSLRGISAEDGILMRPMLDISADEVAEYLNKYSIAHVIDETNHDENYFRNFVRKNITSKLAEFRQGYEENITAILDDSKRFNSYLDNKLKPLINMDADNVLSIKTSVFNKLEDIEKEFLLHSMASSRFRFERRHLAEMMKLLENEFSVRIDLPDNHKFEKSEKFIRLFHGRNTAHFEIMKKDGETFADVPHLGKRIIFSGEWVEKELVIRNRRVGDKLKTKKIKDIFIDKKLDLYTRDTALIIIEKNDVVWVENISHDASISLTYLR